MGILGIKRPIILSRKFSGLLNRFLMERAESSLVLLANSRAGGLEDRGGTFQGTYAAYLERGRITGVAAHYWNGMVFLQADSDAPGLIHAAISASGRDCTGIAGPYDQVQEVLPELLRKHPHPAMNGRETLFSLSLADLETPPVLGNAGMTCRHPSDGEVQAVIGMRIAFIQEHLGREVSRSLEEEARELVTYQHRTTAHWILEKDGTIVATTAFNASIPGIVQVGGVYTRPDCRNMGYGRAVVAGSLLEARAGGVKKAILFTGVDMEAAQKMYRALGFRPIGEYGLVIF
ncbi:MAG: GNAT family N-acetyltransferase [Methanolinea sp.]|nr:GNAT family N-acetyltransferase [Methanolinea sp.]